MTFVDAPSGKADAARFAVRRAAHDRSDRLDDGRVVRQRAARHRQAAHVLPGRDVCVGAAGLGSPLFDTSGRFVGVIVMRNTGQRGAAPLSGVLPADDIREVAKQAPGLSKDR